MNRLSPASRRLGTGLHSLRTRLFASFALLVLLALVMAAGVFVALRRGASDAEILDRVEATVPAVSFELRSLYDRGAGGQQVSDYLQQAGRDHHVRILLVDQRDHAVMEDSGGTLRGRHLDLPDFSAVPPTSGSRFQSWRGTTTDTRRLTFFAAINGPTGRPFTLGRQPSDPGANLNTIVAVPRETVANAWLGLLPGLLWAGLAALALSALAAVLLARSIARPVLALTRASEEIARGNFDQEVPLTRPDEIGRLAAAFNTMAREVGRSYLQTRALIANASHDLKTPLTSILGFAQALRDGAVDSPADVAELSGIIHEEAERIYAIVDDLLYLSQLEAGEVALQRVPVDVREVAQRCLRRLESSSMREQDITIESQLEAGLWVLSDSGKLERIVDNLLDNARKYTPAGGTVSLTVQEDRLLRSGAQDPPQRPAGFSGQMALLSVSNSGSYIEPADRERIFDRFYRADRSRGPAPGGTGLGLAIVKDLVRLQQGSIVVRSDPEHGTTFEVRLPLASPAPDLTLASFPPGEGQIAVAT